MDPHPRIVCCGDDALSAEALASLLRDLVPASLCEGTTWSLLGDDDTGLTCLVALVGASGEKALDGVLAWRARGHAGPVIAVLDDREVDRAALSAAGVRSVIARDDVALELLPALEEGLDERSQFTALHQRLHHLRALLAAGRLAARLPHRLNNPLAALLGEAELMTLETLPDDQRQALERIIELGRRVVSEVKVLDGVMGDTPRT